MRFIAAFLCTLVLVFVKAQEMPKCERIDLDFADYSSGDIYPTTSQNGVAVSVKTRNKKNCIDKTAVIIDTSNPLKGCGVGQGDEDLGCPNCGKALIISTKKSERNTCDADDCRQGGTLTFTFDRPSQVLFLDMNDLDTKQDWRVTLADGSISSGPISEGMRSDLDGKSARISINQNNVKTLEVILKHSGSVAKLSYRTCNDGGMTHGDPHFKSWGGKKFDFHGQCDLIMAKAPLAGEGKGLDIHIRNKHIDLYSYIDRVAMKLGQDILEVGHSDAIVNGRSISDLENVHISGHRVTRSDEENKAGRKLTIYRLYLSNTEWVEVKVFKVFLSVRVIGATSDNFMHASGILGDFYSGRLLARDGVTAIGNIEEFGREWQVNGEDGVLFQSVQEPIFPVQCRAPDTGARRLNNGITKLQAEEACSGAGETNNCIFDILATGDLEMADIY